MKFKTILADPPWHFRTWSPRGRELCAKYPTRDPAWIAGLPLREVVAKDCTLLLWATNPCLPEALRVIDAWGFTYKSILTWMKMTAAAAPRIGLGYYSRACTEHLMVATRGNARAPEETQRPCGAFFCPIGVHSAKPDYQYDIAELYPGPYLELFHRPKPGLFPPREGWTFLGNEVDGRDIRDALCSLVEE